jgi:hypothetical protein
MVGRLFPPNVLLKSETICLLISDDFCSMHQFTQLAGGNSKCTVSIFKMCGIRA